MELKRLCLSFWVLGFHIHLPMDSIEICFRIYV